MFEVLDIQCVNFLAATVAGNPSATLSCDGAGWSTAMTLGESDSWWQTDAKRAKLKFNSDERLKLRQGLRMLGLI